VTSDGDGTVSQYTIDAGGALSAMSPATVATGSRPFSVAVDPTGRYAYVANYTGHTVSQYTIRAGGALSAMSPATVADPNRLPVSVTVDPTGRYVYVANDGVDVSQYTIGPGGALSAMSPATVAAGTKPFSIITTD
jgi:6-phosphogluconolactonase (cycloisomerase 2 family)